MQQSDHNFWLFYLQFGSPWKVRHFLYSSPSFYCENQKKGNSPDPSNRPPLID